jgi:hypothetical protein
MVPREMHYPGLIMPRVEGGGDDYGIEELRIDPMIGIGCINQRRRVAVRGKAFRSKLRDLARLPLGCPI